MNSQQHKRITLKDISEQCGYSVNTVSRALRDDPRLPEATISRIKQVADELGYMKNIIASSMRSGHTNLIAVIVDDIQNPHYSDIISQISIKLRKYGYHTLILASYIEKNYADYSLSLALSYNVSGIVFFPRNYNKNAINLINQNKIPLVLIDREIPECQTDFVRCDDYQGRISCWKASSGIGSPSISLSSGAKNIISHRLVVMLVLWMHSQRQTYRFLTFAR